MDMPGGMHMWRLMCGIIDDQARQLVRGATRPRTRAAASRGANGYRYWTISVSNLDEIVAKCEAAGYKVAIPVTTIRPGTSIAMIEDPDGNWVEFLAGG